MPARGMAAHDQRLREPRQLPRRRAHLPDNVLDADIGTKVVARNRDADAMGIQPSGEVAEKRTVQRLPVTAMDEDDDRALAIAGKEIDHVPRAGTVGDRARGVLLAIGGRIARPT